MSSKRKNVPMKYSTSDDDDVTTRHTPPHHDNTRDVTRHHSESDCDSDRSASPLRAGSASPGSDVGSDGRMRSKKQRLLQSIRNDDDVSAHLQSNYFHPYQRPAPRSANQRTSSVTSDGSVDAPVAMSSRDVHDDVTLVQQLTSSMGEDAGRRVMEGVQTLLGGGASVEEKKLQLNSMIQHLQHLQQSVKSQSAKKWSKNTVKQYKLAKIRVVINRESLWI